MSFGKHCQSMSHFQPQIWVGIWHTNFVFLLFFLTVFWLAIKAQVYLITSQTALSLSLKLTQFQGFSITCSPKQVHCILYVLLDRVEHDHEPEPMPLESYLCAQYQWTPIFVLFDDITFHHCRETGCSGTGNHTFYFWHRTGIVFMVILSYECTHIRHKITYKIQNKLKAVQHE